MPSPPTEPAARVTRLGRRLIAVLAGITACWVLLATARSPLPRELWTGRRLRDTWTLVHGHRMYARVSDGAGPDAVAAVLVHGYAVSSRSMIPLAVHLSPRFRVYALDLPGHGRSAKPPAALDVVELAGAVAAWMSANSVDSAMLVANSFGCQVVAELAVRHPARVLAAVLTGPTIDAGARRLSTQVARLALDLLCEPPSIILLEAASYARFGPRRLWLAFRHMVRDRIEDTLPDVRAPVVIARGARDPIVPRVWAAYLAARAPQATFVEIAGAAHAVHYSAARAVAEVVTALAGRTAAGDMQRPAMSPGG